LIQAKNSTQKNLWTPVWNTLLRLFGEYGASKAGLTLIDYDVEKGLAVIRAAHTEVEKVRAAIASITEINAKPVAVHVLTISGTLKTLRRKLRTRKLHSSILSNHNT
jgi:ribonuclease P/MRP protein subunit POP5